MLGLEVIQSCPSQRNTLLTIIDSLDSASLVVKFDLSEVKPHLPYHVTFQIEVVHGDKYWTNDHR